jgi:hypothetical protein
MRDRRLSPLLCAAVLAVAAVVSLPAVAGATDGQVLITQARAWVGGVTPGDTPGFPVTISRPGSYRLASNLVFTAGDVIVIQASDVTLDLNGFVIRGGGGYPGYGWGINVFYTDPPHQNIVVTNGTIRDFEVGLWAGAARGIRVEKVTATANDTGIFIGTGTVSGCILTDNSSAGVQAEAASVITGNLVSGNGIPFFGWGIRVLGPGSTVTGNTVESNRHVGIEVECPTNLIGNTATGNTGGNLVLSGKGCRQWHNLAP